MDFIGRELEMAFLAEQYRMEHPLTLIMGRRRVGKSRLIQEFIRGKSALYFEADHEIAAMILNSFSAAVAKTVRRTLGEFRDWESAIRAYIDLGPPGRKIIVLDEFQYITSADEGFAKRFQSIWDNYLSKQDVMVILCGSYLNLMKKVTQDYGSPLFGRNTGDLMVQPLAFRDTVGGQDYRRAVEEYAVTGGVPHYMLLLDDRQSVLANVERLTMGLGGPLVNEPAYLLSDEFREVSSYNTYLRVIAQGHRRADKITSAVEADTSAVMPYLKRLVEVGMLERRVPVTEPSPEHSRNGLYVISDQFMALWFRFVYPHRSEIARGQPDLAIAELEEHFIEAHVAFVFEDICRAELLAYLRQQRIAAVCGSYWEKNLELDVVALDKPHRVAYLGECKYRDTPVEAAVLHHLVAQSGRVKELQGYRPVYCLFSVSGYEPALKQEAAAAGVLLFDRGRLCQ